MTLFQLKQNGKPLGEPLPEKAAHDQYLRMMWCLKDLTIEEVRKDGDSLCKSGDGARSADRTR